MTATAFRAVQACWICGGRRLRRVHEAIIELSGYAEQDPELARYVDQRVWIVRCADCGFGQPERLPSLPRFFDRMYDQHWSRDWVEREFVSASKTAIFDGVLSDLERRVPAGRRDLLDVGAHVGKFISMARERGWHAEGIELNTMTAGYARERTGATIYAFDLQMLKAHVPGGLFDAVTLTDVLEHIPEPLETLRSARDVLRPGGCVAIKVPCGPSQLLKERLRRAFGRAARVSIADNLVHVNHFTPHALRVALERCGFEQIEITTGRPERCESPRAWSRLTSNAIRGASWFAARVLPVSSPLTFNLQAYARRKEILA